MIGLHEFTYLIMYTVHVLRKLGKILILSEHWSNLVMRVIQHYFHKNSLNLEKKTKLNIFSSLFAKNSIKNVNSNSLCVCCVKWFCVFDRVWVCVCVCGWVCLCVCVCLTAVGVSVCVWRCHFLTWDHWHVSRFLLFFLSSCVETPYSCWTCS